MAAGVLALRSTTGRATNVVLDHDPMATFPRRIRGRAGDGRSWELLTSRTGVTVVGEAGRLAEVRVGDEGERVVVEFRAPLSGLPADIGTRVVGEAFAHPAVRADRSILVSLPRGESTVLEEVRARLVGARSRVAGVTCLVEGTVRATGADRR